MPNDKINVTTGIVSASPEGKTMKSTIWPIKLGSRARRRKTFFYRKSRETLMKTNEKLVW